MVKTLLFTDHADRQLNKRGLSHFDITYVYSYGHRFITAGMIHCFLRKKDVPFFDRKDDRLSKLIGTTVLISSNDEVTVVTAYRNPESLKKDRKKAKYNLNKLPRSYFG